jgi:hypothetical protein
MSPLVGFTGRYVTVSREYIGAVCRARDFRANNNFSFQIFKLEGRG